METNTPEKTPSSFKEQWEAKRLMKRTMKKAKHSLQKQGFGRRESAMSVNRALGRIYNV